MRRACTVKHQTRADSAICPIARAMAAKLFAGVQVALRSAKRHPDPVPDTGDRRQMTDFFGLAPKPSGSLPQGRHPYGLTSRQMQIVEQVVRGLSNREIGSSLSISEETVKHHLTRIFDKTGVSTRLELALLAVRRELVS